MLAHHLGLVVRPLVGRLLLGQQHFFHGVFTAETGDGEHDRVDRRDEREAAAECLLGVLVQLVRIGELDLSQESAASYGFRVKRRRITDRQVRYEPFFALMKPCKSGFKSSIGHNLFGMCDSKPSIAT